MNGDLCCKFARSNMDELNNILLNLDDAVAAIDKEEQQQQLIQQEQSIIPNNIDDDNVKDDIAAHLAGTVTPEALPHPILLVPSSCKVNITSHISDEVLIDKAIMYLHWHALHTMNCPHVSGKKGRNNQCNCMSYFTEDITCNDDSTTPLILATSRFMVYFAKLHQKVQQQYSMGLYRHALFYSQHTTNQSDQYSPYIFEVPVICDPEEGVALYEQLPLVCMSVM
jgi:hypothetical protein